MKKATVQPEVYAVLAEMGEATIAQVLERLKPLGYKRSQIESCIYCGASEGRLKSSGSGRFGGIRLAARYKLAEKTTEAPEPEEVEVDDGVSTEELFTPNIERTGPMYPSVWAWGSRQPINARDGSSGYHIPTLGAA